MTWCYVMRGCALCVMCDVWYLGARLLLGLLPLGLLPFDPFEPFEPNEPLLMFAKKFSGFRREGGLR